MIDRALNGLEFFRAFMVAGHFVRCPAIDQVVEAVKGLLATVRNQRHFNFIARLEADGGGSRDVQALAKGCGTIELKGTIDFEKMKV